MTRMHADEVHIDIPLVRRLLAVQFPDWADLTLRPVSPLGTDNAIYRLGHDMVVRLPRRERANQRLEKELEWLPRLTPHLPLAIPTPKVRGTAAEGYPFTWSVYTWLRGESATEHVVADMNQLAIDLARFLTALQRLDSTAGPSPGAHNFFRGVPLKARDQMTRTAIASLGERIDVDAVTAAWEAALRAPEWGCPAVWIHGDLDPRNVLVEQGRLCAVIDFGSLGVGDPACDVMAAWKFFSPVARHLFRTALAVDDSTWMRGRGWALSQALMAQSYYTEQTNPTLVREAHRWIAEVLSDPFCR
jgi:aminoglycoside phosphotransferase (APT) family kinase protein